MDAFREEHGHLNCRSLTGLDISTKEGHDEFIDSKMWHGACMRQIEFTVRKLASLPDEQVWLETVDRLVTVDQTAGLATIGRRDCYAI
jgi:hypothetical protein